ARVGLFDKPDDLLGAESALLHVRPLGFTDFIASAGTAQWGQVTLSEVREQTEHWLADYNQQIPHDSLGGLTPAEFRDQHQPQTSSFSWH
ncbi:integrase core domain-containing protein, partial [Xanthomonas euvesicatoria]